MSNTMKNKFEKFLQELFSRGVYTHKKYKAGNHLYGESLKPKSRVRAQSMSMGTHTKFQLETLTRSMTSALHKLQEDITNDKI